MVLVPAGSFWMGCATTDKLCKPDEKPRHAVYLDAFYIDIHEVTVADYLECMRQKKCAKPDADPQVRACDWKAAAASTLPASTLPASTLPASTLPASCLTFGEASIYCTFVGKRLPTEAEWERAARGTDGRIYPWGNTMDMERVCAGREAPCEVGSHPAGVSPVGAHDMAGNVAEWVDYGYHPEYYHWSPLYNPPGFKELLPVRHQVCDDAHCFPLRGGTWEDGAAGLRSSARGPEQFGGTPQAGVRCARSASASAAPGKTPQPPASTRP